MMNSLGLKQAYSPLVPSREHLLKYEPKSRADLPARTMQDSFTSAIIPLSQSLDLQDKYATILGGVRLGRLMEDMDMFAVWVVHQHLKLPDHPPDVPLPYTFVTILVDKIDFSHYTANHTSDMRLSGHVSWVGSSSIETVIWLEQIRDGKLEKMTRALFLMASRNATNTKKAVINPLVPGNDEETKILEGGEARKKRRMLAQSESLLKNEPNDYEQKLVHDIFIKTIDVNEIAFGKRVLPKNSVWMADTKFSTTIFPYPEDRNAHNKVFGGFLMRHALELSWATAQMFAKHRPKLEKISDIAFHSPVDVSSFIILEANVIYTEMNYMEVVVVAQVFNVHSNERNTTNVFYYTYSTDVKLPDVIPRSYHEAMWFIDGRRKFTASMNSNTGGSNYHQLPFN